MRSLKTFSISLVLLTDDYGDDNYRLCRSGLIILNFNKEHSLYPFLTNTLYLHGIYLFNVSYTDMPKALSDRHSKGNGEKKTW